MTSEEVVEFLEEKLGKEAEEVLLVEGFDRAFVGVSLEPPRAIYSIEICLNTLTNQGLSNSAAEDQFWGDTITFAEDCDNGPVFIHTVI